MKKINKFCIFCGAKPESKNKEHIIPKWLIELTGDPKRKAFFGIDVVSDKKGLRMYSFDSFAFPACEKCNTEFSTLEGLTKPIVIKILQKSEIASSEINTFLDWLDKVRIGLWLGYHYLDKNMAQISPHFHIKSRIGTRDRMLIVYRTDRESPGINFTGTEGLSFQHMPSCFSLRVNELIFFNASTFDLCDRRLGFPFSTETKLANRMQLSVDIGDGLQRVFHPVVKNTFLPNCIKLYQPIFKEQIAVEGIRQYYENDYVRSNSLDFNAGLGKIFIENSGAPRALTVDEKICLWPDRRHNYLKFLPELAKMSFDFQVHLFKMSSAENLSKEEKREFKMYLTLMKKSNDTFLKIIKESAERQTQQ